MKTLFIDTHLNDIIIILTDNQEIIQKEEIFDKKNNSEILFPSITKVIGNNTIDEIIIVNGPGSFTGVRLGVTIAKTLAYSLNIPIKMITSLQVMAISTNNTNVAICDNNGYYTGDFTNGFDKGIYNYVNIDNIEKENYQTEYKVDIKKILKYMENIQATNPHNVNPIYIKKIGVEIDKESK